MNKKLILSLAVVLLGQTVYGAELKMAAAAAEIAKNADPDYSGIAHLPERIPSKFAAFFYNQTTKPARRYEVPAYTPSLNKHGIAPRHSNCETNPAIALEKIINEDYKKSSNSTWDQIKVSLAITFISSAVGALIKFGPNIYNEWKMTPEQKQARATANLENYLEDELDKLDKYNRQLVRKEKELEKQCSRCATDAESKHCAEQYKTQQARAAKVNSRWDEYERLEKVLEQRKKAAAAAAA